MSPDNASIMVCGGGGIALDVTRKLKDMGAWVWMLQRSESRRSAPLHACKTLHASASVVHDMLMLHASVRLSPPWVLLASWCQARLDQVMRTGS